MKKLLVLAKTVEQVRFFCQDYGIPVTNVLYVMDETRARGHQNPAYVVLEGFWDRIDAMGIWMALQVSMTTPLDLPNKIRPAARVVMPPVTPVPAGVVTLPSIITTSNTTGTWTQPPPGVGPPPQAPIELDEDGLPPLPAPPEPPAGHVKQFKKIRVPK